MALNKNSRVLHFITIAVLLAAFDLDLSAALGARVGGYQPIKNLNDPLVQEIAKFAVDEYNKEVNMGLQYVKVVKGDTQVVSGTNYKLVIVAKDDGGASNQYEAIIWDKPWKKFRQLTSFTQLK